MIEDCIYCRVANAIVDIQEKEQEEESPRTIVDCWKLVERLGKIFKEENPNFQEKEWTAFFKEKLK